MKKSLIIFVTLITLLTAKTFGQVIPNNDFELWTSFGSYDEPVGWKSSNAIAAQAGISNVFKTTDAHAGSFAIKVTSASAGIYVVPGAACTGDIVFQGGVKFVGGFPYSNRADLLNGFMKYTSGGTDSSTIIAFLFKWNGVKRDTIAISSKNYGEVGGYTSFSQNFTYLSTQSPDSALIILLSSKNLAAAQDGSQLFVDDLQFSGTVASANSVKSLPVSISVYPNPANDFVRFTISNIATAKTLNIYDILGKKVKSVEINATQLSVSTEGMNNSLYFYQVADRNNNVISTGKFSIKK